MAQICQFFPGTGIFSCDCGTYQKGRGHAFDCQTYRSGGAALLLVMPVAVWISGWRWQPGEQSWLLKAAFWVTETVTQPWGVITHLILFGWFLCSCLRFRIKAAIMLFAILAAAILVGQGR